MIEIPGDPEGPEQTRAIAEGIREAVLLLARATASDRGGLRYPSDAHQVLGALSAAADLLPTILEQTHDFVTQTAAPRFDRDPEGGDVYGSRTLAEAVQEAAGHARGLGRALRMATGGMRSMNSINDDIYNELDALDIDDEAPPA
ncbi:hypothetical protein ACGFNU_38750 [Spirillospora sp. NPDC048911]|uniref:hypothetical protein n=1 Tax=Spirillospora sp. NPDC048911 TaxID=3364527 RepID=UPI003714C47F